MRPLFGPRTVVEAAFLVAVPVIALETGLSWFGIIIAGAIAYLFVLASEWIVWFRANEPAEEAPAEDSRVLTAEAEPEPASVPLPEAPAAPAPTLVPLPEPEPPVPAPPAPAPPPEPEPEPLPPAAAVVPIGRASAPRQWNLWDLERLARAHAGGDPAVDEERTYLLMYLRDFAGPDGLLPVDFDALVRQSFGALVANV
jgi:hypothetical protein